MELLLRLYTTPSANTNLSEGTTAGWIEASLRIAHLHGKSSHTAKRLRAWTRAFLDNPQNLPRNPYGWWNTSLLDNNDFADKLRLHLQAVGKYVAAHDIVDFVNKPTVRARYKISRAINIRTAQRWMHELGYRWKVTPKGQYVDGHEREDVQIYRDGTYLPKMAERNGRSRIWERDGTLKILPEGEIVVDWFHDETHFSANDRRELRWVHKDEKPIPRAKTEGVTLMVADFVSADYGWLRSPDGDESARVIFRSGKNREGYWYNEDIVAHADTAMDILDKHRPGERHRLIYDNATIHKKCPDDALSARYMSKKPTADDKPWFGVMRTVTGEDGKPIYGPDGKLLKEKIRMGDGTLPNGEPQSLYFPEGHEQAGVFKGMLQILVERGFPKAQMEKLRAQCNKFKCPEVWDPAKPCCCRRLLFNQPDFVNVPSILENHCHARGYEVIFLPKFHCELNPIEQCWGAAKRVYREYPPSAKEADLETNALKALDSVPLLQIRRFSTRTHRFEDAYRRGLSGKQAAWATKKYHGHRVLPDTILDQLEEKGITRD
ncbi:hypothetical protein BV25DRAFT_1816438 [Artomyces pyxidatus]|uniref:Uncharacterized protein n=1 Tax=Artomyces pyxidatus TaxID=48021 RepID=A0ACB8SF45_9AGAM|nr:hypothetical protein BV25DRAFT_1816438 [Artomyces pyxidatus]